MSERPNILFVLTDHLRDDALDWAGLPELQRLAADGVRFANAYCAAPLCMPARVSLALGRYPSEHGRCGNMAEPLGEAEAGETVMTRLREAGYRTALVGKHHLVDRYGIGMDVRDDDATLRTLGFDDVTQVVDDGENLHNTDAYVAHLEERGLRQEYLDRFPERAGPALEHPFAAGDTADGFIADRAVDWLQAAPADAPWFLQVGFVGPHPPYWHVGPADDAPVPTPLGAPDDGDVRHRRRAYRQRCRFLDAQLGRLRQVLAERGMADDTAVVFTADHGDLLGDFGTWDKRSFRRPSVNVPLIISGPGVPRHERFGAGNLCRALVSHVDLFPTWCRLAGIDPARDGDREGRDLAAILRGEAGTTRDAVVSQLGTAAMVRDAKWKLVADPEQGGTIALYNLAADPRELTNLAGDPAYVDEAKRLLERLLAFYVGRSQYTHHKEEQRCLDVRVPPR